MSTRLMMAPNMSVIGSKTCSTAMARKPGQISQYMKVLIAKVRNMAKGCTNMLMDPFMTVSSVRTYSMGKGPWPGLTGRNISDLGKATICMDRVLSPGPMGGYTRVNINMIRNMDKGNTLGQMGDNTKVAGKLDNSTVLVHIRILKESSAEASGRAVTGCTGVMWMGT